MDRNDVSIATITLARDEREEGLLRKSLQQLANLRLPVFVTDGGSRPGFVDFLRSFPDFILSNANARGVWEQAKTSAFEAYKHKSKFIFYTEPDKYDFFNKLPAIISQMQTGEDTGVVMASRSAAGFATFPAFQQMTETTINNCCKEITGSSFDYTYGPFLLNRQLVPYLNLVKEDIGWGWRPYIFGVASRLGLRVESYVADFSCPATQQEDTPSERIYRMKQLSQNLQGMVLSTSVVLNADGDH